jgi:competence protein ComK
MKFNMMNEELYSPLHEITPLTLAIIPKEDKAGKIHTRILERETTYTVGYSPSKLIDYACRFFGSSLKGRQEGTRNISGITHKAPISVDPSSGMYFFPTTSPTNARCSWIAHSHIDHVNRVSEKSTEIVFKNGTKIILEASYGSVMNQIHRTAQFRYQLDNRIKHSQKHKLDPDPGKEPST